MSKETEMTAVFHFHASAVSDQSVVPVHDPQGSFSVFRTVDEEHGRGDFFASSERSSRTTRTSIFFIMP